MVIPRAEPALPAASSERPRALLALFLAWWLWLALDPWYRQDWLLENLLVFAALPWLVWSHRRLRLSDAAYAGIFAFLCLHEIGAHYTYAEVPYPTWSRDVLGLDLQAMLGLERNHFDRFVHFCFGLLVVRAYREMLDARGPLRGPWRELAPLAMVMASSELFEMIEWQAAEIFGGPLGQAYLGTQGDVWDAQKDSAMAALGAALGLALLVRRGHGRRGMAA